MRRRPMPLASYDRLFPNQDTMPRGGFGNLIALPLQREARDRGCTVFLDEALEPHPDQWRHVAGVARLRPARVEELAAEARRRGGVLGVPDWDSEDNTPSARLSPLGGPASAEPALATVRARLSGRFELPTAGLPATLVDRLRRGAAFANPVFLERQRARLSTHRTPRVICCHEERGGWLWLPRGGRDAVEAELAAAGIELEVADARATGTELDLSSMVG
jgi:hypothetical protein